MEIKELEEIAKHGLTLADNIITDKIPYCVRHIEEKTRERLEEEFSCSAEISDLKDDLRYQYNALRDFFEFVDKRLCTEKELEKMKKAELIDLVTKIFLAHEELHREIEL